MQKMLSSPSVVAPAVQGTLTELATALLCRLGDASEPVRESSLAAFQSLAVSAPVTLRQPLLSLVLPVLRVRLSKTEDTVVRCLPALALSTAFMSSLTDACDNGCRIPMRAQKS